MEEQTNKIYENSAYTDKKNDVQQSNEPPKDYKIYAVISTILSFFTCNFIGVVCGIIAIVNANQVFREYLQGNYSNALSKSKTAKTLSSIGFGLSLGTIIIFLFYMIIAIITGSCE